MKKNEIMSFVGKRMELEIMLSKKPSSERQIMHICTHMRNLDLKKIIIQHVVEGGLFWGAQRGRKKKEGNKE
jgi:hypothetical protein